MLNAQWTSIYILSTTWFLHQHCFFSQLCLLLPIYTRTHSYVCNVHIRIELMIIIIIIKGNFCENIFCYNVYVPFALSQTQTPSNARRIGNEKRPTLLYFSLYFIIHLFLLSITHECLYPSTFSSAQALHAQVTLKKNCKRNVTYKWIAKCTMNYF